MTPAPTPSTIAAIYTLPLTETLPILADPPDQYSCMLVVPDSVVGHIVGHGGKGPWLTKGELETLVEWKL